MPTNKELADRVKRQKKDNAALIDKIEILNNDIKAYERSAKHLIGENNELVKAKQYRDKVINDLHKEVSTYKHSLIASGVIIVGLIIGLFFYGGTIKSIKAEQQEQFELYKDSIGTVYQDTIWTCNDIIGRQSRDLVGAQERFNFAIEYYTSSSKQRNAMEEDMCGIIIAAGKKPDDYLVGDYYEQNL